MNNDNLIHMANQIGIFFESMPDAPQARKDLATHLKKFWDPRMRRAFLELIDGNSGEISDIVRTAVREHRELLA